MPPGMQPACLYAKRYPGVRATTRTRILNLTMDGMTAIGVQWALIAAAISIEIGQGYPPQLYAWIGHPVTWIGALISLADRTLNRPYFAPWQKRAMGMVTLLIIVSISSIPLFLLQHFIGSSIYAMILMALIGSFLVASRSLDEHIRDVATALEREGIPGGRRAVGRVVGRDTSVLDEAGISRAAIESLAENFSDGVIAPVFWGLVAGVPGMAGYKAINTLDSMIGHRDEKHLYFGWASARIDDLVNLPASRITGILLILSAFFVRGAAPHAALKAMLRDAPHHKSPNAGWPEAALAGALGFRLAGPRVYGGQIVVDGYMGNGRAELNSMDIRRALQLYRVSVGLALGMTALGACLTLILAALPI